MIARKLLAAAALEVREVAHWAAHTSGPFQHLAMRGAHFFNHSELAGVATVIRRALV